MLSDFKTFIAFRKSPLVPFLYAMLLVFGFHCTHISNFSNAEKEGTFYEICSTKVSTPVQSFENLHLADLATFEKEEKIETESESQFDFAVEPNKTLSVGSFFLISGAANHTLKIPSVEGRVPLYILFKNFRVHLV